MPSKSKAQQRFMGLVHAYNKGDVKGSEVSKAVKDVAKDMKKKDVKDFASTTHKGKPEKVKQEFLNKLKEMIRIELEGCGYTTSAVDPNYKLKSPGGTGEEDEKLKESLGRKLREGEQEKIYDLLVKYGNTEKDAKQMIAKTYKYIKSAYRNSTPAKKAEIMSSLMKMETKQWVELSEKCWKGYEKKGTKKMFGKTYPNCVKKENINPILHLTEMDYRGFVKYMNDFYGPKGVYPDKKKRTLKMKDIGTAYSVLLKKKPDFEIGYDSTDREMLRDILIKMRKLDPDYSQKEYMNTQLKKKKKRGLEVEAFDKMEMHKLQTAIKMFQNKIKKQGRVTNARDEDHLKQLIKVYKQMGGKKIKEGKLSEGFKKIAKKKVKYKTKMSGDMFSFDWEIESGIDTDVMGGNTPKIILFYQHEDETGFPSSGGNTFWLKHKNGKP